MNTLLLDRDTWDLTVDAAGNIAMASGDYALAQDMASACKLFEGELWYDVNQGVPYWQSILGQFPPLQLIKAAYVRAALTVPGIVAAVCFITSVADRTVNGQVQGTNQAGRILPVGL